jgi:thiosulfate reductase/polysulfide reductase chain A
MKLKGSNPVWINSQDSETLGIASGDRVRVVSPWGGTDATAFVTGDIAPGVLGAAGGFGHVRGLEGDPKFPAMGGVNMPGNLMKPNCTETMAGTPLLKYIKCRLERI